MDGIHRGIRLIDEFHFRLEIGIPFHGVQVRLNIHLRIFRLRDTLVF